MPYAEDEGTETLVVGVETTLAELSNNKTFVAIADLNAMASGDTIELRVYTKALSGGTARVAYFQSYSNAQSADDKIKNSVPVPADIYYKFTIKQTAGVAISVPWKVVSL